MMTYVHQLIDWPNFPWSEGKVGELLAAVSRRQGRLIGRMEALGFQLREEATLSNLTDEVVQSSKIEGEALDRQQVRSSVARRLGMNIGALPDVDRSVEGIVELTLDATQKCDDPLTNERLHAWHAALFPAGRSGMGKIVVGSWRTSASGPMQVVSGPLGRERVHFEAPEASRLEGEMNTFLNWFNRASLDPVLKAAIAHLWFVTIHPFDDGNGRIARAIADMALARADGTSQRFYSMSAQIRVERKGYYDLLEATQRGGTDITRWLEWFLTCLSRALETAEAVVGSALEKADFWDAQANQSFSDRQRKMLNRLLSGFDGKLTTTKWAVLAKCSQDTALRDIDDLLRRGILVKQAGGGRSTNYSLNR